METTKFNKDIAVFYIAATSFPNGVLGAHQKLHSLIPFSTERRYFGISRPEDGGEIIYRAAAEEMKPGEAKKLGCEKLVLKKGTYISLTIHDYMKDIPAIGKAFNQLISLPGIDPQAYCVEQYISDKDIKCMVRLADK